MAKYGKDYFAGTEFSASSWQSFLSLLSFWAL